MKSELQKISRDKERNYIMAQVSDFLMPSINEIRKSIRGIDDSYNNYWDILAELLQNSVDAIKRGNPEEGGLINIRINCQTKEIDISDNGCGIDKDKLSGLLKPFATDKAEDEELIGEKGVGLKFAYFQSTFFKLKTGNNSGTSVATINDARLWKQASSSTQLVLNIDQLDESYQGTEISLKGLENEILFSLTIPQMTYMIRTKTAAGNTSAIWESVKPINIQLDMTDINGNHEIKSIPYKYELPIECLQPNDVVDIDSFEQWLHQGDRSDFDKRQKLKDKVIVSKGTYMHNGVRKINYWLCFLPSRDAWNIITKQRKLADEQLLEDENWMIEHSFVLFRPGIYTAVKGMPTGISVEHPTTGYSGYWSNVFVLFEDNALNFDIGRKSIQWKIARIYQNEARVLFNRVVSYVSKYICGTVDPVDTDFNKEKLLDEIKALPNLEEINPKIKFVKNPKDQEASVAAIFYEMIGAGVIDDVTPLISGYRNKYDLYAKWNGKTVIIEFKSHLKNLVRDFDDARKMFDEINYIVCWEVTDEDIAKLYELSINVQPITHSSFERSTSPKCIKCSTHQMILSAVANPIYVIDLKKVLNNSGT